MRWYTQEQFHSLLAEAGFTGVTAFRECTPEPAGPDDPFFTFVARRP